MFAEPDADDDTDDRDDTGNGNGLIDRDADTDTRVDGGKGNNIGLCNSTLLSFKTGDNRVCEPTPPLILFLL